MADNIDVSNVSSLLFHEATTAKWQQSKIQFGTHTILVFSTSSYNILQGLLLSNSAEYTSDMRQGELPKI